MDLLDKNEYRFVWVTEFPLLEWNEEENRYTAMHHPFTMLMDEDIPLIESGDLGKIRAKAYDIVLNGNEIGGGSVRIHQDDIQERMFKELGFTPEAAMSSSDSFWMHSNTEFRLTPDWLMVLTVWLCSLPRLTVFVT